MDDDAHLMNPAGRLWLLLRDFQSRAAKSTQQKPVSVQTALCGYLGIEVTDRVAYYRSVATILNLPVEVRFSVEGLESPVLPKEMLVRPLDLLERVLPAVAVPRTGAKTVSDQITSGAMSELETCSYVLNGNSLKAVASDDTLNSIRRLADEIIDSLAADDALSTEFREAIRIHARRISSAVASYKICGADAILSELDGLTGVIVRKVDEAKAARSHPVFQRIKQLSAAVIAATALATAPAQIADSVEFYEQLTAGPVVIVDAPSDGTAPPADRPV